MCSYIASRRSFLQNYLTVHIWESLLQNMVSVQFHLENEQFDTHIHIRVVPALPCNHTVQNRIILVNIIFFFYPGISRCPEGWDFFNGVCYFFDHSSRVNYEAAKAACTNLDARLAVIHNQEEQDFIAGKL